MKKILVTGGTVFVSRYIAEYYVAKGYDVYVLNRNSREQSKGVNLIQADRHNLGDILRDYCFDIVIDTAYSADDVEKLLDALGDYKDYILISSSAVYPESAIQPLKEETALGVNKYWGKYGTDKINAEKALLQRKSDAYILRPPYLYGPMNNVYREAFVFDCALSDRKFYLPKDGELKLQFFHIFDLCRFIDILLEKKPEQHIFNVGNKESVSVCEWVELCYQVAGKDVEFINVHNDMEQRNYFCFYDYEYYLDVSKQYELMTDVKPLKEGLKEALEWYMNHSDQVNKKPLFEFIDSELEIGMKEYRYITLSEEPLIKDRAAEWFHSKWGVPKEAYLECMNAFLNNETAYGWYLCLDGEDIVAGLGVIENDFHDRKDLAPNVCAVYTEEEYRSKGIAGNLLNMAVADMKSKGISPIYLVTDHTGFYEKYGWEFLCMVQGDGEPDMTRMYIHK